MAKSSMGCRLIPLLLLSVSLLAPVASARAAGGLLEAVKKGDAKMASDIIKKDPDAIREKGKYETGPLHAAALKGDKEMIKLLLEKGASPDATDHFKKTPLFLASSPEIADMLIAAGADVKAVDRRGNGLLHEAVKSKNAAMTEYYIKKGLSVNAANESGQTPLALSVEAGEAAVFNALMAAGAATDAKEKLFEWSPLHVAIMNGRLDMAEALIKAGAAIEATDRYGRTPLHYVRSREAAEFLLSKNADASSLTKKGGTVLHSAAASGSAGVVKFFIEKGFDMNQKDAEGETPLFKAVIHKSKPALSELLSAGADMNARDANGEHPLSAAVSSGDTACVELLLKSGADIAVRDKYKKAVINLCETVEMAELLLRYGADIGARDEHGGSALHGVRKKELCDFLISKGADVNAQDAGGATPLMDAASAGRFEIAEALMDKKADIHVKSASGETAAHFAVRGFREDKVGEYLKIIDLLAAKGADMNAPANFGETPIFSAYQPALIKRAIEKGAKVNAADNFGRTPLHHAMNAKTAALLLENGAELEARDANNATPLCRAAAYDKPLTEFLVSKGADVNARGYGARRLRRGSLEHLWQAPLLMAAYYGKNDITEFLLARGAKAGVRGDDGKTAMHLAAMTGSAGVIETLAKNGADPNAADNYGNTPLKLALENGRAQAAEALVKFGAK